MADTRTPNLNLAVPADASAEAKANLYKIDALGAAVKVDTAEDVVIRSKRNVRILPKDDSIGGEGDSSGEVIIGETGNLATLTLYGTFNLQGAAKYLDAASGGTKYLTIQYKSDLSGSADTAADRTLSIDMQAANRSLILAGNFELAGGSAKFTSSAGGSDVVVPDTGTLVTLAGTETLTNKAIDADTNTITNIDDGNVKASAAIAGTKISPDFGSQNVKTSGQFQLTGSTYTSAFRAAVSGQAANILWTLPAADGAASQVLGTDGAGQLQWLSAVTGTLAQNKIDIGDISGVRTQTDTSALGDILADTASGLTIKAQAIVDAQISNAAAIALSKLAALTVSRALASSAGGVIVPATTTAAELDFLSGTTSSVQTQLDGKQPIDADLTALAALSTTGIVARTASATYVPRTITAASAKISVSNGDGVAAAPTIDLGSVSTDDIAEGTNQFFTNERVDDRVAALIINSNDFTWTYTDGSNTLSAALANTAITAKTSVAVAAGDSLLISDVSDSDNLKKVTAQSILDLDAAQTSFAADWTALTTKSITHNLGSRDVMIQLYDKTTFETVYVDSAIRTSINQIDLTASSAPTGSGWRVLIKKL